MGLRGQGEGQTFDGVSTASQALNLLPIEDELSPHTCACRWGEQMDWAACMKRHGRPHTLFYPNPSYWGTGSNGVGFGLEQYDGITELVRSEQNKVMMSGNDVPEMHPISRAREALPAGPPLRPATAHVAARKTSELVVRTCWPPRPARVG